MTQVIESARLRLLDHLLLFEQWKWRRDQEDARKGPDRFAPRAVPWEIVRQDLGLNHEDMTIATKDAVRLGHVEHTKASMLRLTAAGVRYAQALAVRADRGAT